MNRQPGPHQCPAPGPTISRALASQRTDDTAKAQALILAFALTGMVALSLGAGLLAVATTFAMSALPSQVMNIAGGVFLVAATVVSCGIVVTFWHHLVASLAPAPLVPVPVDHGRPPRPLRMI